MGMKRSKTRQQLRDKEQSRKGKTRTDEDEEKNKINLKLQNYGFAGHDRKIFKARGTVLLNVSNSGVDVAPT